MHDVAIIGAGLSGSLAAIVLARYGVNVVLIDRYDSPVREFRAEQIVGSQIEALHNIDVLHAIVGDTPMVSRCAGARYGRIIARALEPHYGLPYADMVSGAQSAIPASVTRVTACLRGLATMHSHQIITTEDNRAIEARLVICATGLYSIASLGFFRDTIRTNHCLTVGFDIDTAFSDVLAYYGERLCDRIDYLTIFPMQGKMRANLFAYIDNPSPWLEGLRAAPDRRLDEMLPGLRDVVRGYTVRGKIEARSTTLSRASQPERYRGVVLIGDAFQTSCPGVGAGISRIISDVSRLSLYVPQWLQTPGMGIEKTTSYYEDRFKIEADREALRIAEYRRNMITQPSIAWRVHRGMANLKRRFGPAQPSAPLLQPGH